MDLDHINPSNLPSGTRIGEYEVLEKLGHGGMGDVYKVRRGRSEYALKIASQPQEELTPEQRVQAEERTRREIATLTALKHPNIVHCHGFDKWPDLQNGYLYFVTDLIQGQRLYIWQSTHNPSLRNLVGVFLRLAGGLYEIHHRGVFHRDIKSENLLVRSDGEPILIDFGIARPKSAYTLTSVGSINGTATHLSPGLCRYVVGLEATKGRTYSYGQGDDLHQVGFMFYEMLAGRPPFEFNEERDEWELFKSIANDVPVPPSSINPAVPASLNDIALKLLAKQAKDGFEDAQKLGQALEAALEGADARWDEAFIPPRRPKRSRTTFNARGERVEEVENGSSAAIPLDSLLLEEAELVLSKTYSPNGDPQPPPLPLAAAAAKSSPNPAPAAAPAATPASPELGNTAFRSVSQHRPAFLAPDGEQIEPPAPEARLPTDLVRAAEALQKGKRKLRPAHVAGGALLLTLLISMLLPSFSKDKPKTASLLQEFESARLEGDSTPKAAAVQNSGPVSPLPPAEVSAPAAKLPSNTNVGFQRPLNEEPLRSSVGSAERERGSRQRVIGGRSAKTSSASWVKGVAVIGAPQGETSASKNRGGRLGGKLRARLMTNLDSRTLFNCLGSSCLVEGILRTPYFELGVEILPPRSRLFGQAQVTAGRFGIHFNRARLPDGSEVAISADAIDATDRKPGLAPSRRLAGSPPKGDGVVASIAKGAATTVLDQVSGDLAGEMAASAGKTAINHRDLGNTSAESGAIILDSGEDFEAVVREAF